MAEIAAANVETYLSTKVRLAFNTIEPEGCLNEKAPIIFLHGLTSSKEHWNDIPQFIADATKRKVYAVDARNHGDSEWSNNVQLDINVDDLLNFMDSINAPKAVIVGHSMGGCTGMKTALKAPERIEKLVVEDITLKRLSPEMYDMLLLRISLDRAAILKVPVGVEEEAAKSFIANFVDKTFPPHIRELRNKSDASDYNSRLKRTGDGHYSFKANLCALEEYVKEVKAREKEYSEYTGFYAGPACFIYGKMSLFHVESDKPIIKLSFPNAELVGIDNATHGVHTDCPNEFKEALLKFLLKE